MNLVNLVSINISSTEDFKYNLDKLLELIDESPINSIITAPELVITGFYYKDMVKASDFANVIIEKLKIHSFAKTVILTIMIARNENKDFFNTLYIFHNGNIVKTRDKYKLFKYEKRYFKTSIEDFSLTKIDNLYIADLICFELRFVEYWIKIRNADIIVIPSFWGKARYLQFLALCKALAIVNQCFVLASNSANEIKAGNISYPDGKMYNDLNKEILIQKVDLSLSEQVKDFLATGL